MHRPVVLVCQPFLFRKPGSHSQLLEAAGFELRYPSAGGKVLDESQLGGELHDVAATLASTERYTAAVIARAPHLRVIARTGVGYDSIDVAAATARRVVVACTPGANHDAVAEHVFSLLLGLAKRVTKSHAEVTSGEFRRRPTMSLRGKTLGLIGFGRTGRAVARRATAFGMRVIAYDPWLTERPVDAPDVEVVSLDKLLASADILSLHAAATDENRKLINGPTIAQMKDGVILINTARGTLVDEEALSAALASGKVAAAGLDVFEREPPFRSPLLSAPNLLLSPHLAGVDEKAIEEMATMAARTIIDLHAGRWPSECIVNANSLPAGWKWE